MFRVKRKWGFKGREMNFYNVLLVVSLALPGAAFAQSDALTEAVQQQLLEENEIIEQRPLGGSTVQADPLGSDYEYQAPRQQPTTFVEASPLDESQAERLRRRRQKAEIKTEQKIVEKLERSRLDDEARRAKDLFGDRLQPKQEEPVVQPVVVQQVQPVIPDVAVIEEPTPSEADLRAEIASAVRSEYYSAEKYEDETDDSSFYIGGLAGVTSYTESDYIDSRFSGGFSVGAQVDPHVVVEGSFIYSNHFVGDRFLQTGYNGYGGYGNYNTYNATGQPLFDEVDQYNLNLAAKYLLLTGKIKPHIGALVSFVRRNYQAVSVVNPYTQYQYPSNRVVEDASTNAVDVGLTAGLDFDFNRRFGVGADFKYVTNITYSNDSDYLNIGPFSPLEEIDYFVFTINGKIRF